jgi:hypothetical protein
VHKEKVVAVSGWRLGEQCLEVGMTGPVILGVVLVRCFGGLVRKSGHGYPLGRLSIAWIGFAACQRNSSTHRS